MPASRPKSALVLAVRSPQGVTVQRSEGAALGTSHFSGVFSVNTELSQAGSVRERVPRAHFCLIKEL